MIAPALLSAPQPASLPVTGADVVLYLLVAAIVTMTGLVVRRASRQERVPSAGLSTARKLQ
jgi:hypothetical protein